MPALADYTTSDSSQYHPAPQHAAAGGAFYPPAYFTTPRPSHGAAAAANGSGGGAAQAVAANGGYSNGAAASIKQAALFASSQHSSPSTKYSAALAAAMQQQQQQQQQQPQQPQYHPHPSQQQQQQQQGHSSQQQQQAGHDAYSQHYSQLTAPLISRQPNQSASFPSSSSSSFNPSSFNGAQQQYYGQIPVGSALLSSLSSHGAGAAQQASQYGSPYYALPQGLAQAPHPQRPVLVAGRVVPAPVDYSKFYEYGLKPGRMPPFDLLAANLHKKKVNLACHFCDHAARRPGRQKTALLISCQSAHCRKVFCSRPSCYKKLPAELGITSPDRFAEWKRQVEAGQNGATFVCPHCRDEAACPGPQCAKRWKKRHARMQAKKTPNPFEEVRPQNGAGAGPMTVSRAEAADKESSDANGGPLKNEADSDDHSTDSEDGDGTDTPASSNGASMPPPARPQAGFKGAPAPALYPINAQSSQPRMDVLAGVTGSTSSSSPPSVDAAAANAQAPPPAHQQLLQFLQHQQQTQGAAQQSAANGAGSSTFAASTPAADSASSSYAITQFSGSAPATSSTPSASNPAVSPPASGSYPFTSGTGSYSFTSPNLSPLMSPQPQSTAHPSLAQHSYSSNSPVLAPLSPMTNASPPSFYSPSPRMISTVPSLSLTPTSGLFSPVGPKSLTGEAAPAAPVAAKVTEASNGAVNAGQ